MCTGLALALTCACYLFPCRATGLVSGRMKTSIAIRVRRFEEKDWSCLCPRRSAALSTNPWSRWNWPQARPSRRDWSRCCASLGSRRRGKKTGKCPPSTRPQRAPGSRWTGKPCTESSSARSPLPCLRTSSVATHPSPTSGRHPRRPATQALDAPQPDRRTARPIEAMGQTVGLDARRPSRPRRRPGRK